MKAGVLLRLGAQVVSVVILSVGSGQYTNGLSFTANESPIPRAFFGMHIHRAIDKTPWPNVVVPTWRLWDAQVKWPDLEPSKGQWRFDTLDKYVTMAEQHNTEILLPLATTPQWASARPDVLSGWQKPGLTAEPADMNDWRTYVKQVVTRYKGRIHAYEIWNEPNLKQFWIGNTDQLVAMTKAAHDIIKSVDPAAILVSPSATTGSGVPWLADFLSKGGGRFVDVIGYHFYVFPQPPEAMLPLIERVKRTMKENGIEDKPIWDTELGWAEPKPFPSDELAAAYLARSFVLSWAAGIQRVYWYAWDNHSWVSIETTDADNKTVRPAGQAYGTIQNWLLGASMDACNQSAGQIWTCQLHRGDESQWIVWTSNNAEKIFPLPSSWHAQSITSLLGVPHPVNGSSIPISQVPVLVVSATSLAASIDRPEEPRYTPPGGTYAVGQKITLSSSTPGVVIHYTVDGSQASLNSPVYNAPRVLTKGEIVRAIAVSGTVSSYEASATFNVTSSSSAIPASFLGLTVLDFTKLSPPIQFGTTRSWDAYPNLDWSDVNASPDTYNFAYLDKFIAINQARGAEMIYTLGRTPRWASSQPNAPGPYGPGECAPPANMSYYENYLRAIVTHVAGRIRYWELWNEPQDVKFYCGDIPAMVTMAQEAARIIKGIDPTALILSPAVTGGPGPAWLSSFLSEGGAAYVDVITFHGYWSANAEDVVSVISNYRSAMEANGVPDKPLWDTESSWAGFGNLGAPSSSHQVGFIAKDYLLHWSMGVPRFVWFAYDGGPTWGGLWNLATGPSPAAKSYREIYRWIVGATLTSPCSANENGIWTCILSRPGGYIAEAVWISNRTASFTVPPEYAEYLDLAGTVHKLISSTITVGDQPLLLENETLP
jgi:GH35 family endo-1,4-beta-xylanase